MQWAVEFVIYSLMPVRSGCLLVCVCVCMWACYAARGGFSSPFLCTAVVRQVCETAVRLSFCGEVALIGDCWLSGKRKLKQHDSFLFPTVWQTKQRPPCSLIWDDYFYRRPVPGQRTLVDGEASVATSARRLGAARSTWGRRVLLSFSLTLSRLPWNIMSLTTFKNK